MVYLVSILLFFHFSYQALEALSVILSGKGGIEEALSKKSSSAILALLELECTSSGHCDEWKKVITRKRATITTNKKK